MARSASSSGQPDQYTAAKSAHPPATLGVRWTIGDVSEQGFEALRLSVWGAWHAFGPAAVYAVCVNAISIATATQRIGLLPTQVEWIRADDLLPDWLVPHLDRGMAEGVGWKFAPVRVFPQRYELALDNDCILWKVPNALQAALRGEQPGCVIAADTQACFGQFSDLCGPEPRNSGIRGTPGGLDFERVLRALLHERRCVLRSETDEQGLQVAALTSLGTGVVSTQEVSICSPFPAHSRQLGSCGAHFVGLNARDLGWKYYDRPASEVRREHWYEMRPLLYERVACTQVAPD